LQLSKYPHIESSAETCSGQPRISGTRITVSIIAHEVEHLRLSPDEVVATHPHLTLAEIHAALAYFYDHRDEIESGMREAAEIENKLRARFLSRIQELVASK
jgi:uncharacterized protein (DUF433 family)